MVRATEKQSVIKLQNVLDLVLTGGLHVKMCALEAPNVFLLSNHQLKYIANWIWKCGTIRKMHIY